MKRLYLVRRSVSPVFTSLLLTVLLTITASSACHASSGNRPLGLSQFIAGIVTRSSDLNYITEQDSEVFAFYRNAPVAKMNNAAFLTLLRLPADTKIVRQSWSSFFQLRTQNDSTGKWRILQSYLEANLTELAVLRLPRPAPYEAQYDLYAVGIFNSDTVVGVQMFGVAT